jgi:hypothetical protein
MVANLAKRGESCNSDRLALLEGPAHILSDKKGPPFRRSFLYPGKHRGVSNLVGKAFSIRDQFPEVFYDYQEKAEREEEEEREGVPGPPLPRE